MYDTCQYQKVRHERAGNLGPTQEISIHWVLIVPLTFILDHHSAMLNVTSRLAVKIENMPDWEVDWSDKHPQCSRHTLTCSSDFLPSAEDASEIKSNGTQFMTKFLASEFSSLKDLSDFIPTRQCTCVSNQPRACYSTVRSGTQDSGGYKPYDTQD